MIKIKKLDVVNRIMKNDIFRDKKAAINQNVR